MTSIQTKAKIPSVYNLISMSQACGAVIQSNFFSKYNITRKADRTPRTKIDSQNNEFIINQCKQAFPEVSVIAEERSHYVEGADHMLLCDPMDGTLAFTHHLPLATVCLSLVCKGTPIAAVIHEPFIRRTWFAEKDGGAFYSYGLMEKPKRIFVSKHRKIERAHMCVFWWKNSLYNIHLVNQKLIEKGISFSSPDSMALMGALIASAKIHASIAPVKTAYETAPIDLIVREAGGKATDMYGNELLYDESAKIKGHIISNGVFHKEIVEVVASCQ